MKMFNFLVLGILLIAGYSQSAFCQGSRVTVQVVGMQKESVAGMVILNPGLLRLGKTQANGEYTFKHKCQVGQTFKAEPEDRAKYYDSEERTCSAKVILEVIPRPHYLGATDSSYIQLVNIPAGATSGKVYAGIFGVLTDKVESVSTGSKVKCKLTIDKRIDVGFYAVSNSDWSPVTEPLPKGAGQQDGDIYYFPSSCENSWLQIGEIKRKVNLELKLGISDYYVSNSKEIGNAVVETAKLPR